MIRGKMEKMIYSSIIGGFCGGSIWNYCFDVELTFIGIFLGAVTHYLIIRKK